jgi:hypothetical protein
MRYEQLPEKWKEEARRRVLRFIQNYENDGVKVSIADGTLPKDTKPYIFSEESEEFIEQLETANFEISKDTTGGITLEWLSFY